MRRFLVIQLAAPLASWGEVAVGEDRPSASAPSLSAVLGLLAAAVGLERSDPGQEAFLAGYGVAVRVYASGEMLRDYHTVQQPPATALKKRPHETRRDELDALFAYQRQHPKTSGTIVTRRDYRADGRWAVAVWARDGAPYSIDELAAALARPKFPLYLGRKSCPPSLPLSPTQVDADSAADAFARAELPWFTGVLDPPPWSPAGRALAQDESRILADEDVSLGVEVTERGVRIDRPLSRRRWQFARRTEVRGRMEEKR